METPTNKRENWIDELRGFGILWVVLGHTIERTTSGLDYSNGLMHFFDVFANSIHIYILFLVSGYVYGIADRKKINGGTISMSKMLKRKSVDVLLPYFWFGLLIWIGKMIFAEYVSKPITFDDIYMMFVTPIAFAWYLYVLFIILFITIFADYRSKCNNILLICISIGMLIAQVIFEPQNVTLDKLLHNYLIFVFGIICANNKTIIEGKLRIFFVGVTFAILTALHYKYDHVWLILDFATHFFGAYFFMLLFYRIQSYFASTNLRKIGELTLFIYLLHPIVINSMKAIYLKLGLESVLLWIISLFILGVLIPFFYGVAAQKLPFLDFLFRPRKYLHIKS